MTMEPIYNLPKIQFVGGETQELCFRLKSPSGRYYTAEGMTVNYAVRKYGKIDEPPVINKTAEITLEANTMHSVIEIRLDSNDTLALDGRYVYQITVAGDNGIIEIPGRGILEITRNINPDFLTGR